MSDVPPPPEVLAQILSWLPVKPLLQLRCVSKSWRALIDSQYFIQLHLSRSIENNTNFNLLFGGDGTLCYLDFDASSKIIKKIKHPLYHEEYHTVVVGSCNGIVCTSSDIEFVFWNPYTPRFKKILLTPAPFSVSSVRRFCIEGFGYDKLNDDYKLVTLIQYCGVDSVLEYSKIEVYNLKSNCWRKVGDFPYYVCYQRNYSVFASSALHWLVSQKPEPDVDYLIAAFDLTTEKYWLVPQPEFSDKDFKVNLAVLGGCLCMVCNHHLERVDIWVMMSYGVKDSWTKLISTSDVKVVRDLDFVRPILYSKSRQEVLIEKNWGQLFWYDLEKKKVRRFRAAGMPDFFAADIFVGSLVRVDNGGASGSGGNEQKKKKKDAKKRDDFLSKGFKLVL